ncbi:hypothetical protein DCAR_0519796 [Daucus carota subsp. sativus]|uniref:Uncharacterized protein n=1 Tax=Daucus carota subsp. sativus TaxID=79200 RepID=A0A164Y703_DAUCS|nr:hypothetical protein DCAR_0519796 [Daucus carota subsp. sativus]
MNMYLVEVNEGKKLSDLVQQHCVHSYVVHTDSVWALASTPTFSHVYSGGRDLSVAKIKCDEREDLKVLATGLTAALVARKSLTGNVAPHTNEPAGGRIKSADRKLERTESLSAAAKSVENQKQGEKYGNKTLHEDALRVFGKASLKSEGKATLKISLAAGSLSIPLVTAETFQHDPYEGR